MGSMLIKAFIHNPVCFGFFGKLPAAGNEETLSSLCKLRIAQNYRNQTKNHILFDDNNFALKLYQATPVTDSSIGYHNDSSIGNEAILGIT